MTRVPSWFNFNVVHGQTTGFAFAKIVNFGIPKQVFCVFLCEDYLSETPFALVRAQHQDFVPAIAGGGACRESAGGAGEV